MEEDVTKIYEEYSEELLFCKYFIAEKLKHHAEMGRCGENILKKCLQERFQMLEFVTALLLGLIIKAHNVTSSYVGKIFIDVN